MIFLYYAWRNYLFDMVRWSVVAFLALEPLQLEMFPQSVRWKVVDGNFRRLTSKSKIKVVLEIRQVSNRTSKAPTTVSIPFLSMSKKAANPFLYTAVRLWIEGKRWESMEDEDLQGTEFSTMVQNKQSVEAFISGGRGESCTFRRRIKFWAIATYR